MHPAPTAKRLRIAFINNEIDQFYGAELARGVSDAAREQGIDLVMPIVRSFGMTDWHLYQYNVSASFITPGNVDAVVLAGGTVCNQMDQNEFQAFLASFAPLPVVSIGRPIPGGVSVTVDNASSVRGLVDHFIREHGYRNICIVGGRATNPDAVERRQAVIDALAGNGLSLNPAHDIKGDFGLESGLLAGQHILDHLRGSIDAVIAANDIMAIGISKVLQEAGLHIPADIAIAGFDDVHEAANLVTPLTTVRQPIRELGREALLACMGRIAGEKVESKILPARLVLRESCGCPPSYISDLINLENGLETGPILRERLMRDAADHAGIDPHALLALLNIIFNLNEQELGDLLRTERHRQALTKAFGAVIVTERASAIDFRFMAACLDQVRGHLVKHFPLDPGRNHAETLVHAFRSYLFDLQAQLVERNFRTHQDANRSINNALAVLVDNLTQADQMFQNMVPTIEKLDIKSCAIWLYDQPIQNLASSAWTLPETLVAALHYAPQNPLILPSPSLRDSPIHGRELIDALPYNPQAPSHFVLFPLFVLEEQLGVIACSFDPDLSMLYDGLVLEIAVAVKLSILMRHRLEIEERLRSALRNLEQSHDNLALMSTTDELTGLLNRRGFQTRIERILSIGAITGMGGLLCFADMDGLKHINDNWGHDAGDNAIKAMADILRKTFRSGDTIARMGGDEFTVIILDADMNQEAVFQARMEHLLKTWNQKSNQPWTLAITLGSIVYRANGVMTVAELLRQADEIMYERKRQKKGTAD